MTKMRWPSGGSPSWAGDLLPTPVDRALANNPMPSRRLSTPAELEEMRRSLEVETTIVSAISLLTQVRRAMKPGLSTKVWLDPSIQAVNELWAAQGDNCRLVLFASPSEGPTLDEAERLASAIDNGILELRREARGGCAEMLAQILVRVVDDHNGRLLRSAE